MQCATIDTHKTIYAFSTLLSVTTVTPFGGASCVNLFLYYVK
jgi:hypothetical protein